MHAASSEQAVGGFSVRIDANRLQASITEFARIGATPGGGVTRLALSDEDRAARDLLRRHMDEAGMTVRVDDLGTMTGHRPGAEPGPAVLLAPTSIRSSRAASTTGRTAYSARWKSCAR